MSESLRCGLALGALAGLLGGCTDDPRYVEPGVALEVGAADSMITEATASVSLPIRLETDKEIDKRNELAEDLEIAPDQIPLVPRNDVAISLEWTVRNLGDADGSARILLNGANQYFAYNPMAFVEDPEEEETPPPLAGDVPLSIPAGATMSGVFREDTIAEASLDLDLITRGGLNPFTALLAVHEDTEELTDPMSGTTLPSEAFASLIRFDVTFTADQHMVLEISLRVRDERRPPLLHEKCLDLAADPMPDECASELTMFAPADYVPPMMPAP